MPVIALRPLITNNTSVTMKDYSEEFPEEAENTFMEAQELGMFKEKIELRDSRDFYEMIEIFRWWGITHIPDDIYTFIIENSL